MRLYKSFILFIIYIFLIKYVYSQSTYNNPILKINNSNVGSYHINSCNELINFSSSYSYVIPVGGEFIWDLFLDNQIINTQTQLIKYDTLCAQSPNIYPSYNYSTTGKKGTYKLRLTYRPLKIESRDSVDNCFIFTSIDVQNIKTLQSNSIVTTRFDDNSECKCETNPDVIQVNCNELNLLHEGGTIGITNIPPQDVKIRARQTLTSNCVISSNGYNVTFVAGTTVSLKPGFSSGNNYRAYLDDCDDGIIIQRIAKDDTEMENTVADIERSEQKRTMLSYQLEGQIEIYPNPTSGIINIHVQTLNQDEPLQLRVLDVFGKEIIHQQINNSNNQQIDLSPYGKGVYFLQVINHNQESVVKKAVVQ
jgi:hypothetical protein